jgi:hypothetical protein
MSVRRIKELTWAITQHGLTVPAGYTFDPRGNPPLFPTAPLVANELPNESEQDTDRDGEDGEDDEDGEDNEEGSAP